MVKGVNPMRQHLILRKQYDNRFRKLFRVMIHQAAKIGRYQHIISNYELNHNDFED